MNDSPELDESIFEAALELPGGNDIGEAGGNEHADDGLPRMGGLPSRASHCSSLSLVRAGPLAAGRAVGPIETRLKCQKVTQVNVAIRVEVCLLAD